MSNNSIGNGNGKRFSFWDALKRFETALAIVAGVFALVIPAVVALIGYSYAVQQLQTEFETRACDLDLRLNAANAKVRFFELERELRLVPEPNEFQQSAADVENIRNKRKELELAMGRQIKIAKFYTEAQANGMQNNCSTIKLEAIKL